MASGIFALLDDIAILMDDVAAVAKVATKKTAGILADDLAVNAEKASGFLAKRELPVLWKLTKGAFINKVIILPVIFLLSAFLPAAIVPILLVGGAYLSFEGALKSYKYVFKKGKKKARFNPSELSESELKKFEDKRIKSALLIDFILSIEIIIIALGTVLDQPLKIQIPTVSFIAILATIGVYGIVALLVRIDDVGYRIVSMSENKTSKIFGRFLVESLPVIIRILNVVGTLAMLLVGGGIFVHNLNFAHDFFHGIPTLLADFIVGLGAGIVLLFIYLLVVKLFKKS